MNDDDAHLDDRLRALRALTREWAAGLHAHVLELDRDPGVIHRMTHLPALAYLATCMVPPGHQVDPVTAGPYGFHGTSALERTVAIEEFAAVDAGALLAAPGPSLSGALVAALGDEAQRTWYYGRILERPTWTFLALTEPEHGSDAAALGTSLTPGGDGTLLLSGTKRYIGNAARARMGVVFARTGPGPLGVTAVLVDTGAPGFAAEPIPTIGLRAAQVCAVTLDRVPVPPEHVLGRHLPPSRRGLWSGVQMFNALRPGVAAIGVGVARAAHAYVTRHRAALTAAEAERLAALGAQIAAVRRLVHRAAAAVDADPAGGGYLASAAKARACRLAEDVTLGCLAFFGPAARLEHPLLDKYVRDARGLEFMEGTGTMQKLNVFRGLHSGRIGSAARVT
ncbi:acyl-CoA dehydrogenase family protein [Nonomuraea sp. B12E4]|uniref:acyl-CoA dehydrogenase family protein n=1 Tax=Nonomuraea sp. B12E4 TaxID=3153564 RepID=UPI00325F3E7B